MSTPRRWIVLLFFVALAVRGLALWELSHADPYFGIPVVDEQTHHQEATRIASGELQPDSPYWKPPLYAHLVALTYWPGFEEPSHFLAGAAGLTLRVKILQALLDAVTAVCIAFLGARILSWAVGIVAGFIYAFAFTPVYYCAQLLDTTLFTFLCVVALTSLVAARRERVPTAWLWSGCLIGLATITRAPALLFLPVAAAATLWRRSGEDGPVLSFSRANIVGALCVIAGTAVPILPVTLMNWKFAGDSVLISANGGYNFYVGNRRGDEVGADGLTPMRVGPRDWEVMAIGDLTEKASVQSRRMYEAAFREIAAAPGEFIARLVRKTHALVDGFEIPNNKNFREERERSWILWLLPGRSGLVMAFGLVGIVALWRRFRERPLWVGFLITQAIAIVGFFVAARYRVPLTAVLTIPAAALILALAPDPEERAAWSPARRRAIIVILLLVLLALNIDFVGRGERYRDYVIDPLALANAQELRAVDGNLSRDDRLAARREAGRLYRQALELDPDYPHAENNLGLIALGAADELLLLHERRPTVPAPVPASWARYGSALYQERARRHFRRAIAATESLKTRVQDFRYSHPWNNLGRALLSVDRRGAEENFVRAIAENEANPSPHINLGQLYESSFRVMEAREQYQLAYQIDRSAALPILLYARASLKLNFLADAGNWLNRIEKRNLRLSPPEQRIFQQLRQTLEEKKKPPPTTEGY